MELPWQHECVYGCSIIFETHTSNVQMIYTQKYHVIYFLYFVYGTWMWVCASADLGHFEEEYPAWVIFSHLPIPISCIITRNLPKKLIIFSEKNLEGVSFHYMSK